MFNRGYYNIIKSFHSVKKYFLAAIKRTLQMVSLLDELGASILLIDIYEVANTDLRGPIL